MSADRGTPLSPADLPRLALARPNEALSRARALLASTSDPIDLTYAKQAIGIVIRERGEVDAAITELEGALRLARKTGNQRPGLRRTSDLGSLPGAGRPDEGRPRPAGPGGAVRARGAARQGPDATRRGPGPARTSSRGSGRHPSGARRHPTRGGPGLGGPGAHPPSAHPDRGRRHRPRRARRPPRGAALHRRRPGPGGDRRHLHPRHHRVLQGRPAEGAVACTTRRPSATPSFGVPMPDLAIDRGVALLAAGLSSEAVEIVLAAFGRDHAAERACRAQADAGDRSPVRR